MNTNEFSATEIQSIEAAHATKYDIEEARANLYKLHEAVINNACLPLKRMGADPIITALTLIDVVHTIACIAGSSEEENSSIRSDIASILGRAANSVNEGHSSQSLAFAKENNLILGDGQQFGVFSDQGVFMTASGQSTGVMNLEQATLYRKLVSEEFIELDEAFNHFDAHFAGMKDMPGYNLALGEVAKEACDVIVVAAGLLQSLGIKPQDAWDEVMGSNLSKINPETGTVLKREDGKVLKGPNFRKADMESLVANA